MKKVIDELYKKQDLNYKEFISSLIPNISEDIIIGVRIPDIRKLSKMMSVHDKEIFLTELPHKYLEENILHSILINEINDFDKCIYELERFLHFVDNWSVCDTLSCKILCSNYEKFFDYLISCLNSNSVYKIRFVFVMMMNYFINDEYIDMCNKFAVNYKTDEYYINMSIAWYFSYALINQYEKTIYIFENKMLSKFVHNKSISKCIDSYRIGDNVKNYLKGLRVK